MWSYCLKCRKNIESKDPKVARSKNGTIIVFWKYAACVVKNQNLSYAKMLVDCLVVQE